MIDMLVFDWGGTVMTDSGEPGPMFLWEKVSWVPGAEKALEQLRRFPCCIATNAGVSDTQAMIKALKRVGAYKCFQFFFSSKDLGYVKPDPRFFRMICRETRMQPAGCVMIGNDYGKDICGAKEAGMRTVFYYPGLTTEDFPMADAVIRRMDELPAIILRWDEGGNQHIIV
ncbi:MAG TPA: HAD family hydrolase [Bacteroidales bacterium]|nr:HAD family hydrolase [Bacteroidales bacterium]